MEYRKVLSRYYIKWFQDCHDSASYCREQGRELRAQEYLRNAEGYLTIIMENWDAIEYFSADENRAFVADRQLPVEFRGL